MFSLTFFFLGGGGGREGGCGGSYITLYFNVAGGHDHVLQVYKEPYHSNFFLDCVAIDTS